MQQAWVVPVPPRIDACTDCVLFVFVIYFDPPWEQAWEQIVFPLMKPLTADTSPQLYIQSPWANIQSAVSTTSGPSPLHYH